MMPPRLIALSALCCALLACGRSGERAFVTVVTTPDIAGTGIVTALADRFSAESKVPVKVVVTDESLVDGLVRDGVADVVLAMEPELERELRGSGKVLLAQTIAYDDYVLVGPRRDPARVRDAKTAAEGLRRIARRDRAFCSPVDVPELRWQEELLWKESPADADDDRLYRTCSGTALDVLKEASRRGAYTLTDRASFESARRDLKLVALVERTPLLRKELTVLLVRGSKRHQNAQWFVEWVMSFRGRELIERYQFDDGRRWFAPER